MAELTVVEDERPGIKKEIDEGAMDLIFQAIQEDIYSFPIKSFVRESISNGLDSIVERNIAKAILSGEPEEKYYIQRQDGKLLKDSSFVPAYYDINHLSENNIVKVVYQDRDGRDLISIIDQGVGLGGSRLKGFFKLGYSSKRNMKDVIGKFGAGAKAGLATGVEYFTMHTIYNGYKTSFMIYKNDYENITPRSEAAKVEVWKIKMANDSETTREIYWTPCNEPNGVQIDLEVKTHNKQRFLDAVTQQFQYFGGRVQLQKISENGQPLSTDTLDAKPLYESEALLIPKYSTYNSPHILVDGISYGLISWDELELERRNGKIAIKVSATDVDITQSRESLKWTEKTKNTILSAIKLAKEEAEDHVASLLTIEDPDNLIETNNMYGRLARGSDESVGSVFSKFLDMHNIMPRVHIKLSDTVEFKAHLSGVFFDILNIGVSMKKLTLSQRTNKTSIQSTRVEDFYGLRNAKIIYGDSSSLGPKLCAHLLNKFQVNSLVYVRPVPTGDAFSPEARETYMGKSFTHGMIHKYTEKLFSEYCTLNIDNYDVVYDEKEEELEEEQEVTRESLVLIRKANKEVLYTQLDADYNNWNNTINFKQVKKTVRIDDIAEEFKDHDPKELVICTGKFKDLGKIVEVCNYMFSTSSATVLYVAQDVVPYFAPHGTVITDYLRTVNPKTGELMIGSQIRNLNTWRLLHDIISKYPDIATNFDMLGAFSGIDATTFKKVYQDSDKATDPKRLILNSTGSAFSKEVVNDIFGYLDGLLEFQKVLRTADADLIAKKSQELFQSDEIYAIDSYDEALVDTIKSEFDRLQPIRPVLALMGKYGDFQAAKPLIELLLNTLNTKES